MAPIDRTLEKSVSFIGIFLYKNFIKMSQRIVNMCRMKMMLLTKNIKIIDRRDKFVFKKT